MACARRGDDEARRFLFARLDRVGVDDEHEADLLMSAVLDLDGLPGALAALRVFGRRFQARGDDALDSTWLARVRRRLGDDANEQLTAALGPDETAARAWLDLAVRAEANLREERRRRKEARKAGQPRPDPAPDRRPLTHEDVIAWARTRPESCGQAVAWNPHADAAGLRAVAEEVVRQRDPAVMRALLCVFFHHAFPLGPDLLVPLVWAEDDTLAWRAAYALRFFGAPEVRETALLLLREPRRSSSAAPLFVRNFEPGDEDVLRAGLELALRAPMREEGEARENPHAFVRALKDVAEAHPTPGLLALLAEAYAFQPCAHCRAGLVRLLDERGALPDDLREEAALDASEELRAWLREEAR